MSGHLHCIAFREHYQLLYSLLHPAKVDQLYFVGGNMPSSTNWTKMQPSIYLALVLGPYPHGGGGTYLLMMTKNISLFLSNLHIRRHMC